MSANTGRTGPEVLTLAELQAICPRLPEARAWEYLPLLVAALVEAEITTPARVAAFLAQVGHESNDLRSLVEIGGYCTNYDTGRLAQRLGNTPAADGDGCLHKGRGPIQITGLANYRAAGEALGVDLLSNPDLAATPEVGFRVAAWYWTTRGLNALADRGDFDGITRRINGGLNGKADRDARHARARRVLAA